jgi:receptor expression-enhancing protein 5/6
MPKKEKSLHDKYLEQMKLIQEKTGIPGTYVLGALLAAVLFVWIGFLERLITNLVGTIYPAFWTIKSIESRSDDDKHWLTYWVVFACFTIIDMFSGFILKFIPFYFFLKIIFLIWLFMPNSQGCNIVYHLLVVRVFKCFEQDIDSASVKLGNYTKEFITQGNNILETKITETLGATAMNTAASMTKKVISGLSNHELRKGSVSSKNKKEDSTDKKLFEPAPTQKKVEKTTTSKNTKKKTN